MLRPPRAELLTLLRSPWHEERLLAFVILVRRFERSSGPERDALFRFYLRNLKWVNNWDLVDLTAPHIVGAGLGRSGATLLARLAGSRRLWDRRVAVLATLHFIRQGDYADTLRLCRRLLADPDDLIHKACGWMLREVGHRDRDALERFLGRHAAVMPRTMLRYAIERLPATSRRRHLSARARAR